MLDTYFHVLPNMQEEAAEKVAALVFGSLALLAPPHLEQPHRVLEATTRGRWR